MACQYWYNNAWRSEEEFKNILDSGLLDNLIKDKKVSIPGLKADAKKAREFAKAGIKKQPLRLRIINKIQARINNEREPITGAFVNNNPVKVLAQATAEKKQKNPKAAQIPFLIVIKVKGELKVGKETKNTEKLRNEILNSKISGTIVENLKEGIPYMMVPSAYGLYPIQMKSHAVKDTTAFTGLKTAVKALQTANPQDFFLTKKNIEKMLYQTTIDIEAGKYKVVRQDPTTKLAVTKLFSTAEETSAYLGNLLYRCDYTKINSVVGGTDYNTQLANIGAVSTDLFSEDGNFFNSSSFVIEAYQISPEDKATLELLIESKVGPNPASVSFSNAVAQQNTTAPAASINKADESPIFNTPIDQVNAAIAASTGEIIRDYTIAPNTNFPIARVIASVKDGVVTVQSIQLISKSKQVNQSDKITISPKKPTSKQQQAATKAFFESKDIIAIKEKATKTPAPTGVVDWLNLISKATSSKELDAIVDQIDKADAMTQALMEDIATTRLILPETSPTTKSPSAITAALQQMVDQELTDLAPEVEEEGMDTLEGMIARSKETVAEEPIAEESMDFGSLFDDEVDIEGKTLEEVPNAVKTRLRQTPKTDGTKWSKKEEITKLREMIGNRSKKNNGKVRIFKSLEALEEYLPAETYEMLLEARKHGKQLHGVFTEAALYLSENAAAGTTYHEAFHVIFNLALPLETRVKILNEALEKYPEELPLVKVVDASGKETFRMPTFIEIEELLADKFMDYVMSKEEDKFGDKDFEFTTLGKTFRGMYRMLEVFFHPSRKIDIDQLFEDINWGVYKYSVNFRNTVLPFQVKLKQTDPDHKYDNGEEERQAFVYMQSRMDDIFDVYRSISIENENKTEREIINTMGVDKFYTQLLSNIFADAKLNRNNSAGQYIMKLYSVLTNGGTAASTVEIEGKLFKQFNKPTDLLQRFNQSLVLRGLHMSYKGAVAAKDNLIGDSANPIETNEENTKSEAWMKGNIEMDPRDSMSQKLKSFFATIPKFVSNRKDARPLLNVFNVQEKEEGGKVFGYLLSRISDSYSVENMMEKLQAIKTEKPYIVHIIEKMEQDSTLKTELWLAIGQKHFATFSFAYDDNGEYKIIKSNRKNFGNIVRDEIIGGFLIQGNPLFEKDAKGRTNFEDINLEKVDALLEALTNIKLSASTINKAEGNTKKAAELLFKVLSNTITKVNINISPEDIYTVWNPETGKASWKNIENLINTLIDITTELSNNKNPFLGLKPDELIVDRKVKGDKNSIEKLGRILQPALEKEVVSAFRNIEGNTVYNLILSNFLNKQLDKFKNEESFQEYLEQISKDSLLSNLPFIKDLNDPDSGVMKALNVIILDGLARKGKKKSVTYEKMSDIEMMATELAMFQNSNSQSKAKYKLPIPSDAPTIPFLESSKFTKEELVDKLTATAKAEFSRITKLRSNTNKDLALIPNYLEKGVDFQILSFLNSKIDKTKVFNEKQVRALIEEFLNNKFIQDHIAYYKKKGIITAVNPTTGEIAFADGLISKSVKNKTEFFKDFLYNTYYMNTQLTTVFGGDPAFYKSTVDYQKRYKQIMSPGIYTDTANLPDTYNAIILNDEEAPTAKETVEVIVELIKNSDLNKEEKAELTALWKTAKHNLTDAATFISPLRKKQQLQGLKRWTPPHEDAYQREIKGLPSLPEDLNLFQPEKPFFFTQRIVNGTVVPTQIKNSEIVLTRELAYKKDTDGNFKFPKLVAIYNTLMNGIETEEGVTRIDTAIFESAVKVGALGNSTNAKGKVRFTSYELQEDGTYALPADTQVITLKSEEWRLQQETPEHYIDSEGNFGTQLRNLAIGDMDLTGTYNINGKSMTGEDVAKLYQELIAEDLKSSFEELKEVFENKDGSIDYERLAEMLRKEVISRDMGQEYLDALAPIKDAMGNTTTTLPLYHPLISYKMMAVMNSFFQNRVTKQKIAGGAVINASSYGVNEDLKFKVDKKLGKITLQAMMPWTSRKYFPLDANGEVDMAAIKANAPELLRIIGYRIPNEDKYSTFNIEIVGFTPPNMGGLMMLPVEVTTLAGLDFDIDKMYMMARSFYVNKRGNPVYIKYVDKVESEEDAQTLAKNIFSNFKDYKRFVLKNVEAKNVDKMLEGRTDLLDKLALDPAIMADKEDISKSIKELKEEKKAAILLHGPDSRFVKYIQDSLDDLYLAISDAVPFNETQTPLTAKHEEAINFIAKKLLDKDFNAVEFNSSLARDNKKLEIIQGIFENKNTALSILNPGNFDSLKENAARIRLLQAGKEVEGLTRAQLIKETEALDNEEDFNINYPSTQLELFRRNMTGKQLIGIFANHNTHHAKAQYTDLQLKTPIVINGVSYSMLNQVKNEQGSRISKSLATDLAAVVDTAKDPIASFLNMNTFTANTQALLQRLGVNDRTVFALLNQPIILELTQKYFNDKGSLSEEKHLMEIKAKWLKTLTEKLEGADIDLKEYKDNLELNLETLENNIYPSKTLEYYAEQYRAINAFEVYYKYATELGTGVQAAKVDTTGVGPTSATNFIIVNKQNRLLEKIKGNSNTIIGLDEVFKTGTRQIMIPAFNKWGIEGPINILNKIFASIGNFNAQGELNFSSLGELKNWFDKQKGDFSSLTEKEAGMIDINYINFLASKFPFFDYSKSANILNNLPDALVAFKKEMPTNSPYSSLLNSLYVVAPDGSSNIKRIDFYTTGKNSLDTQRSREAWERMLIDENPAVKELALKLVQYTFFSAGYGFGPFTFANIVPVKFWTNKYQIENNIVDSKGRPFNLFLSSALESDFLKNDPVVADRFKKQFIQNYADKEQFTKTVKVDKVFTPGAGKTKEQLDFDTTMAAKEAPQGVIMTAKGNLIVNRDKNPQLLPFGLKAAPVKYIKVYNKKGGFTLYEYKETAFDQKNNDIYEGKTKIDTVTYFPINTLGTSNFALEFNYNDDISKSILEGTKKVATASPISQMDAEMDRITQESLAGIEQDALQDIRSLSPTTAPTTSTSPLDLLGQMADRNLEPEKETPAATKSPLDLLGQMADTSRNAEGLFEKLGGDSYKEYTDAGGTEISKKDFLSLSQQSQDNAIFQAKNCK
jgi:hypothetical protein